MSLRTDLAETLERWEAGDPDASSHRAAWLALANDERLLTRRGHPAHFTASALPITAGGDRVCLVLHGRMGMWVQPGGHFEESDRSVQAAAAREMAEETGLEGYVDPAPLRLSRHVAPCREGAWHLDVQLLAVCLERPPEVSSESQEVAWFQSDRLPAGMAPGVADLVRAGRERLSRSGSPVQPPPEA